jgi:hypothetical protein
MDHGEEEVYEEGDVAEQGEGEGEEGGFDEDELDSALADVQGALQYFALQISRDQPKFINLNFNKCDNA